MITERILRMILWIMEAFVPVLAGCDRNRNNPGWDYFPDMFYSTAYESYTWNPNFADGMTMRAPVPGSISREIMPFEYGPAVEERTRAGNELTNPFMPVPDNL